MKMNIFVLGTVIASASFAQNYQEWLNEQNSEMNSFVKAESDALKDFAEQEWKEYKSFVETPSPKKPGPKKIPEAPKWVWKPILSSVAKSSSGISSSKVISSSGETTISSSLPLSSSQRKSITALSSKIQISSSTLVLSSPLAKSSIALSSSITPSSSSKAKVLAPSSAVNVTQIKKPIFVVDYFGVELGFDLDNKVKLPTANSESAIKKWIAQTSSWSNKTRESFSQLCKTHNITGWAQLQLANVVAQKIHGSDLSSVSALSWWLLGADKVDVRLAFLKGRVVLLYHTTAKVYGVSYLRLDTKPYYLFNNQGKKGGKKSLDGIRTWPQSLKGRIEVNLNKTSLSLSKIERYKELVYRVGYKLDTLKLPRNSVQEKLWSTYPLVDITVPFNHTLAKGHHTPLIALVKEKVSGMSQKDAVRFLLNLVQKSFKYEADDDQFGYENYFFPEEILGFRASDCEDRAVFFSYLIKNVVGIPVVLLDYPSHIAAAVSLNEKHKGAQFRHKGKLFYVADPTYLGADIGMEMKGLDVSKRLVID